MIRFSFLLTAVFVVVLCGCGKQVSLKGKVVFSDDNSPLTAGTICFTTPTFQARGDLDKKGNFTMGSFAQKDGLPPDTYKVAFIGACDFQPDGSAIALLDDKWYNPETSGLTVNVDRSTRFIEVKVDRPSPKVKSNGKPH